MNQEIIALMKKRRRIYLNKIELFWHFSPVLFFLMIPLFSILNLIAHYFKISKFVIDSTGFQLNYIFIIPALVVFFIQNRKLNFKEFKIKLSVDQFQKTFDKTSQELDWTLDYSNHNFIKAHRKFKYESGGSWGEMITIIKEKDRILINSICNPNGIFISLISYGWNKKNIKTFIQNALEWA